MNTKCVTWDVGKYHVTLEETMGAFSIYVERNENAEDSSLGMHEVADIIENALPSKQYGWEIPLLDEHWKEICDRISCEFSRLNST